MNIAQLFQRAQAHHQAGRLDEAAALYKKVLKLEPAQFDALCMMGLLEFQRGRGEESARLLDRAVKANPYSAIAYNNRGNVLRALKRLEEALSSYDRAVALQPGLIEAMLNRAVVLRELGRLEEALAGYREVLAASPDHVDVLGHCGTLLCQLGRFEEARTVYGRLLALQPDNVGALNNLGNALIELGCSEEALGCFDRALARRPDYVEAVMNRSVALRNLKRIEEALEGIDRAVALRPDLADAHCIRGNVLQRLNRLEESLAALDRTLALRPDYAKAWVDRSLVLKALGRIDESLADCARAQAIEPEYAEAHFCESLCRLSLGDFRAGWEKYEWRWRIAACPGMPPFAQPMWRGHEALAGRTILLHAEQGFGDTIQFGRYAKRVAEAGARVLLEVQPELKALMARLEGPSAVFAKGEPLPDFDLHCPLLSLPLAFDTRLETIPGATPYLSADPRRIEAWGQRLGPARGPRVGLAWSGRPAHFNDHNRSRRLAELAPLFGVEADFVSLQKEVAEADRETLAACPDLRRYGEDIRDFSDTAAIVHHLDLVISVDTSVAHLAGAMGKPVWVLLPSNPDWRWLLEGETSPWYPTVRLFRQDRVAGWPETIRRVAAGLAEFARAHGGSAPS
jgi:tetratricopeptide (TPR) repeat protein